jgi:hypothetical protein
MTHEEFLSAFIPLQKYFGHNIEKATIELYWSCLKHLNSDQFKTAVKNIIDWFKPSAQVPFPLVAHFKEIIGLAGKNRAQLAIIAIRANSNAYKSVSFGDFALHITIDRFGGWPVVARWTVEDWGFKEKSFIACYEASQGLTHGPKKLCGIFETENNNKILSGKHLEIAKKQEEIQEIKWPGYSDLKIIENKNPAMQLLEKLTDNIGKKI